MLNKAMFIGNIGRDPEIRYTQSGKAVASFSLACTEKRKGQDGQQQEHTEWVNVVAWGRLAEICGEYLGKGSKVYVEGKLQTRKWKDQQGVDRYTTEIVIWELKMLSPKRDGATSVYENGAGFDGGGDTFPGLPQTGEDVPF